MLVSLFQPLPLHSQLQTCKPEHLLSLKRGLESVTESIFSYDVEFFKSCMGWLHVPHSIAASTTPATTPAPVRDYLCAHAGVRVGTCLCAYIRACSSM